MIPIVSEKYKYIFFYNPKSACSVARQLFLKLHRDELTTPQIAELDKLKAAHQDEWHELSRLYCLDNETDYADFFKFTLVRHPATRLVSAYLNRVVLHRTDHDQMKNYFIARDGNSNDLKFSFRQFCEYIASEDKEVIKNEHFLPQTYINGIYKDYVLSSPHFNPISMLDVLKHKIRRVDLPPRLVLNEVCKVETLNADLLRAYKKIFSQHADKLAVVEQTLNDLPMYNVTYTSDDHIDGAADLSAAQLADLKSMPPYSSFIDSGILQLLEGYFALDMQLFNYTLNVDQSVIELEKQKARHLSELVPSDFDWNNYLALNADLPINGIDTQIKAVSHWIHHGRFEDRDY